MCIDHTPEQIKQFFTEIIDEIEALAIRSEGCCCCEELRELENKIRKRKFYD